MTEIRVLVEDADADKIIERCDLDAKVYLSVRLKNGGSTVYAGKIVDVEKKHG